MSAATGSAGGGGLKLITALLIAIIALVVAVPVVLIGVMAGFVAQTAASADGCVTGPQSGEVHPSDGAVRLPVKGKFKYTSEYGMRTQPKTGVYRLHAGVDLATIPTGGPILAAKAGTVQTVTHNAPGAGNYVTLNHGGGLSTRYLHMDSISVRQGQKVKVGQKVGVEGNTTGPGASISTGAHLHFEVRENGEPTDAAKWLKKNGINLPTVGLTSSDEEASKAGSRKPAGKKAKTNPHRPGAGSADQAAKSEKAKPEKVDVDLDEDSGGKFKLPAPNMNNRKDSRHTNAMPIPANIKKLYVQAARKYGLPWELLAGIGQTETHHGRNKATSDAGAVGHMQFMPAAWVDHGTDGDGDGKAEITNPADSIHSAANKLRDQGAAESPEGVKKAILRYNVSQEYLADVLYYAQKYGKGEVSVDGGGTDDCGAVDMAADSGSTSSCPATKSAAEKGLNRGALNSLRCGKEAFPWVKTMYGVGERAGAPSDHENGDAVDFMIPGYTSDKGNKRGWQMAKWLQKNATKLDVDYVIFDQKIWSRNRADEGWRSMENRGSDTENHVDHVHVSAN